MVRGTQINRLETVDFLKEMFGTCKESLPISAVWLELNPKQNEEDPDDYDLVFNADFNLQDTQNLKPLLQKRDLEIKKVNKFWVISKARKK